MLVSGETSESVYRSFSSDVTAAILVYQNNEMAAILVYGTGISSFLFKYFVLFHHPTGATDHVSENDLFLYCVNCLKQVTRGFIFVFIYIELSQIYKSIFKLTINYSNSHIVQDERRQISCESPLAWRRLDAAWMQLCL